MATRPSIGASLLVPVLLIAALPAVAPAAADQARQVLEESGVQGGLVVHAGCGDGALTIALRANERYVVHGLATDAADVARARQLVQQRGLAGAVTIHHWPGRRLPHRDNLVNLLVVEDAAAVPPAEILRVLAPAGVACVRSGGAWRKTVKPRPGEIDEWTHYLHDASGNAVAHDSRIGPPRTMQWLAEPTWSRNHHKLASISALVSAAGRIFYIADEAPSASMDVPGRWSLQGRDAFNGTLLWKRDISSWAWTGQGFRSGPVQLPRTLVAGGERVYAPLGIDAPTLALDAATGRTVRTYAGTENTEELVLHDGVLLAVVGVPAAEQAGIGPKGKAGGKFPNTKRIVAFAAEGGKRLWQWAETDGARLMPLTLAAAGRRAFLQAGRGVTCLGLDAGEVVWQTQTQPAPRSDPQKKGGRKGKAGGQRGVGWSVATLVVQGGVVLSADAGKLVALNADSGKELWSCPCKPGFRSPSDVFVIGGLVWLGPDFDEGRDLRTGEVRKTTDALKALRTAGHHHRCYRQKATDRYILEGHRGIEMLDLVGEEHSRNNWVRGGCQYGVMPCNGLIYAPPHACGCYMEGKLYGFWAVAGAEGAEPQPPASPPMERGPAYATIGNRKSETANSSWPTYRHDPSRSGSTAMPLAPKLAAAWQASVGGRLTAPVAAGGVVLVASVDDHRVVALDARDGKPKWTFLAGGRVDSPPTVHEGTALFGCADGWVYCLRLADGQLAWRLRAAPDDRCTVAREQVESVWPAHGSVLIEGGVAYVTAGRYSYLDGGIFVYGLDPATGKVLCSSRVRDRHPKALEGSSSEAPEKFAQNATDSKTFQAPDHSDAFSMGGARSDVLVSDGESIYVQNVRLDRRGEPQEKRGRHLFSTARLLDDAENHRSHWVIGTGDFGRMPVAYSWIVDNPTRWPWQLCVPHGLMLAFDGETIWGARRAPKGGYTLFAERNTPPSAGPAPLPDFRKTDAKPRSAWKWSADLAMRPRAILRAGDTLLLAGVPGLAPDAQGFDAFEGRKDGLLWSVSTADGSKLAERKLPAAPIWDGLAAADGRLYVCLADGKVVCLAAP